MSSVNKAILVGRIGDDPIIRETNGGLVANFSMATDETYKDKQGERTKKTEWHKIVVWGKLAEVVEKYLGKGDLIYVEGKMTTRSYEDAKTSTTKYVAEIVAYQLQMLQTQGSEARAKTPPPAPEKRGTTRTAPRALREVADEDIPF